MRISFLGSTLERQAKLYNEYYSNGRYLVIIVTRFKGKKTGISEHILWTENVNNEHRFGILKKKKKERKKPNGKCET
jgi:hypothetical protein